jgi:hypothetical protein
MCLAIRFIACVGELGVAFWECEHDYLEDSHDCGGVAREWNFAGDGAERSPYGRPTACGRRR